MKYTKITFIFLISFTIIPLFSAQKPSNKSSEESIEELINELESSDIHKTEKTDDTAEDTDLKEWKNHLDTLNENWNASTNIPNENWTKKAIDLATNVVVSNKELLSSTEKEFFDAINKKTTELTSSIIAVIDKFNTAIRQAAESLQKTSKEKTQELAQEESVSTVQQESSDITPTETEQSNEYESTDVTKTTDTTISNAQPEAATSPTAQSEEKEITVQDWQKCISTIKNKQNNLTDALTKANDIAKILKDSDKIKTNKLIEDFSDALDLCMAQKRISQADKITAMNEFMNTIGIYTPISQTSAKTYYEPVEPFVSITPSSKYNAEIERKLAEQEQAIQAAALEAQRQKEDITQQAALLRATQAGHLSASQWQQAELSRLQAEQAREAESLRQSQETAQKLASQLKNSAAEQKAISEKSFFSRAKETISGFIFGPTQPTQSAQSSAAENDRLLEKMVKSQTNPAIRNAIKEAFSTFQKTLFAFKEPRYWDDQKHCPNTTWVDTIKSSLLTLIKHKILPVEDAIDIVVKALDSYPQIDNTMKGAIKSTLRKALKEKTLQVQLREQTKKVEDLRKKAAQEKRMEEKRSQVSQEMLQRELTRKAQLELEQQERQVMAANQDFNKKTQDWAKFLRDIENSAPPTISENHRMTNQAIQIAENILKIASQIPTKSILNIEEQLKQDFVKALLLQQKQQMHSLNIYEDQKNFDAAINNIAQKLTQKPS